MTRKQQIKVLKRQIKEMLGNFEKECLKQAERALQGGFVPPEYKEALVNDNHLLAKAVIDSMMRNRPFAPLSPDTKKEFENIHICL